MLIANQRFRDFEMPANSDTSFWTDIGLTARRPFRHLEDYEHWIKQLKDIPRYFQEQMGEMRAGLKRGFTPPRVTMEGRDASITAVTDTAGDANLLYTPFKEMNGIAPQRREALRAEALKVSRLGPAGVRAAAAIHAQEYVPGLRTTIAAGVADGKAYCRPRSQFTTLDMEPAAIMRSASPRAALR